MPLSQAHRSKYEKLVDARAQAFEKSQDYSTLFASPVGKSVLADLEDQFGGGVIVKGDPYGTHAKAGAQEVLHYIQIMIRGNPDDDLPETPTTTR